MFNNKTEHTNPLFKELEILPFDSLVIHKQACFMWKLTNNIIPTTVKHYFNTSKLPTGMRQGHKYLLPYKRLDISRRHINYSAPIIQQSRPGIHTHPLILKIPKQ